MLIYSIYPSLISAYILAGKTSYYWDGPPENYSVYNY